MLNTYQKLTVRAADNANSSDTSHSVGSGKSISIKPDLASIPGVGGALDGLSIVAGYEEEDTSTVAALQRKQVLQCVNYATGAIKVGFKRNC